MVKRSRELTGVTGNVGKRRKGENENEPAVIDPVQQQAAVTAYMFHALRLLGKALKKAKTVEAQKVNKKLKLSREPKEGVADPTIISDLEAQLVALKDIELDPIALHLLNTRLPKLSYLHPILTPLLASLPSSTALVENDATSAAGKSRNRVLANKLIKEAWGEIVRAVGKRMGQIVDDRAIVASAPAVEVVVQEVKEVVLDEAALYGPNSKPFKQLSKRAQRAVIGAAKAGGLSVPVRTRAAPAIKAVVRQVEQSDESEVEMEYAIENDSEIDDDEEVMRELARLDGEAGDDGSASDFESGSADDLSDHDSETDSASSLIPSTLPSRVRDQSISKPTKSDRPVAKSTKLVAKVVTKKEKKPITSSAFLPSLASGYISYSDSDGEDAKWVKAEEKEDKKERKNRRGQRARQAIWEQKYGSGANHIAKETGAPAAAVKGSKANRGDTTKPKKRAADAPPQKGDRHAPFDPSTSRPGAEFNPNTQPILARTASKVEKGMHPSWEAKRRATELAASTLADAPKGKKIVFG